MKLIQIAHIENDFPTKFGLPRQSGLNMELQSRVVFEKDFARSDLIRGIEEFSHLWLIWGFSEAHYAGATVRPPRLGGNERRGVFACRTPFRPNPLGLTVVKLLSADETALTVAGADACSGTPVYDIKPYIPYADSIPDAVGGFAQRHKDDRLTVVFPEELRARIPSEKQAALVEALSEDPRPAYQDDPSRVYGFFYAKKNVRFKVDCGVLTVTEVGDV